MNSILGGDIRFVAKGGNILMDQNHLPMQLNEVVNIRNKIPKLGEKTYIADQIIIYHIVQ